MKRVLKGAEPPLLLAYRQTSPNNAWKQCCNSDARKEQIQQQIKADQGGLCAYCEINFLDKTATREADFRVEHFHPKSDNSTPHNWHLDWSNLLGCCHGGSRADVADTEKRATSPDHSCDVPKGNKNLTGVILNPLQLPAFPAVFSYQRSTGSISVNQKNCQAAGINAVMAQNTIDELHLDAVRLRRFREKVLNKLNKELLELTQQGLTIAQARTHLAQAHLRKNSQQHWPAFFSSIRDYLGSEAEAHLLATGYQG